MTPPRLKDILLLVKDGFAPVEICTPENELEIISLDSNVPIALSEMITPASPFDFIVLYLIFGLLNSCIAIPERLLSVSYTHLTLPTKA